MRKIILLDLNKTLAVKCRWHRTTYYPQEDVYSKELVDRLHSEEFADWEIHLVTARLKSYEEETMKRIADTVGLRIDKTHFKPDELKHVPVHFFKKSYAEKIMAEHPDGEVEFLCIESNAETRNQYRLAGIKACITRDAFLSEDQRM